jgi:hypothetical protein
VGSEGAAVWTRSTGVADGVDVGPDVDIGFWSKEEGRVRERHDAARHTALCPGCAAA